MTCCSRSSLTKAATYMALCRINNVQVHNRYVFCVCVCVCICACMGCSPGQFLRKQSFTSFGSPEQFLPPQAGVGLLHARTRVCVPLSQLVLQSVHCVHVLQPPCPAEETGGEERGKLTFHFAAMCQVAYYINKVSGTPSSPCLPTITQIAGLQLTWAVVCVAGL